MATRMLRTIAVGMACALVLSACLKTKASDAQVVAPPDAGATEFGSAFSMDEGRLVARAEVGGEPVVYVFDAVGSGWAHSDTIHPPVNASAAWGHSVAVSGDVIAVADPWPPTPGNETYGVVTLYEHDEGQWGVLQNITSGRDWANFADGVWLGGDGLVVRSAVTCDGNCSLGDWTLYHRYGNTYTRVFLTFQALDMSVGVDDGRFALAVPGEDHHGDYGTDNILRVIDANVTLPTFLVDEMVPFEPYGPDEPITQLYRKVDLAGDVLAYESCCTSDNQLHIRRFDGTTYQPEATFPLTEQSESVAVLPGVVLVAYPDRGLWQTYAYHEGEWKRSSDLRAPDAVAEQFAVPPVAVGDKVAVQGDGVIHVLTIEVIEIETD